MAEKKLDNKILKGAPAVFAIGSSYQIMVPVTASSVMWVKVGNECFTDDVGGILRSEKSIHRITVPMETLDNEKKYTICTRKVIERKPRFSETEETEEATFSFKPVTSKAVVRAYHISDSHNYEHEIIAAAEFYKNLKGDIDFLIMNGDIPDHCGELKNFYTIYRIAEKITGGNIPIVFSRGNRDVRGLYAENTVDFLPFENGTSFYTFRLANIWGLVLDCGENKGDAHPECGNMAAFHSYRIRETEYIKEVISRADKEYLAEGITHRIVICHIPFTRKMEYPFNAEDDIYQQWITLLEENIRPDLMICGHEHIQSYIEAGETKTDFFHDFPVAVASKMVISEDETSCSYAGAGLEFTESGTDIVYNDFERVSEEHHAKRAELKK